MAAGGEGGLGAEGEVREEDLGVEELPEEGLVEETPLEELLRLGAGYVVVGPVLLSLPLPLPVTRVPPLQVTQILHEVALKQPSRAPARPLHPLLRHPALPLALQVPNLLPPAVQHPPVPYMVGHEKTKTRPILHPVHLHQQLFTQIQLELYFPHHLLLHAIFLLCQLFGWDYCLRFFVPVNKYLFRLLLLLFFLRGLQPFL